MRYHTPRKRRVRQQAHARQACPSAVGMLMWARGILPDQAQEWYREDLVGRALLDSGVPREQVFLISKLHPRCALPPACLPPGPLLPAMHACIPLWHGQQLPAQNLASHEGRQLQGGDGAGSLMWLHA